MAELLKLVLKTFWSATFMGVPAVLLRSDQFNGWTSCFLELIRRPVPQARPLSAVRRQQAGDWLVITCWIGAVRQQLQCHSDRCQRAYLG